MQVGLLSINSMNLHSYDINIGIKKNSARALFQHNTAVYLTTILLNIVGITMC